MKSFFKLLLAICCWPLFSPIAASSATHVWSGNGINDLFTTAANWSAGGVPVVGEAGLVLLQFPANSGSPTPLDNIPGLAVDGISFAGGNYALRGSGGVTLTLRRVTGVSIVCTASGGLPNRIESSLPLVIASTTRVQTDYHLNLDSAISGIGGLKCEGGDIHLRGTASNTFAFTTRVIAGTLHLEKSNNVDSIGGDLIIEGATVENEASNQLGATGSITIRGNGAYKTAFAETLPALHFDNGTINLPFFAGIVLAGNVSVIGGDANFITGHLGLSGAVSSFDVAAGAAISLTGTVANGFNAASGIQKLGPGVLALRGDNTYTGNITVEQGVCSVQHSNALGTGSGSTSVNAGASMLFGTSPATITVPNETLHLAGTVHVLTDDVIWNGPIVLTGTVSQIQVSGNIISGLRSFIHTGVISGTGKLAKTGPGRLVLEGNAGNTYSGGTVMEDGELFIGKTVGNAIPGGLQINAGGVFLTNSNQIASTAAVTINGGVLDVGSRTDTIGLLSGTGGEVKFALGTLTTGGADNSTWSGLLSGHGVNSLVKSGAGTLTLTNAANGGDTLTGAILVNQGTLQMEGLHPGPITVNMAGQVSGSGTVGFLNVQGGKVSFSALKTAGLVINGAGSQAITELKIGSYGQIKVIGGVNLTQSSLSASLTYVPYAGSKFMLLENDGTDPIIGIFNGLPEGSPVIFGKQIFNISYQGGTGNDVVLTLVSGGLPPLSVDKFTSSPVPGNPGANTVLIEGTGQPGVLHVIESSSDLINWKVISAAPIASDAKGHSSTSFLDDNPSRRFYRIKEVVL